MLATIKIFKRIHMSDHSTVMYNPEDYAAAGGEMLVIAMIVSWTLTYFFDPEVFEANPLKDRVGYNNLCVGWDMPPAKYVAAPMFALIIFFECRYVQLDYWRAQVDPTCSPAQKQLVMLANFFTGLAWFASIGIFAISPMEWPTGHTASFVQVVVFGYIAFFFNFIETPPESHPKGSYVFLAFFGINCVLFGCCAMIQMIRYDPVTMTMGPVPWYIMATLDYSYFGCMGLQGFFRPRAPSLTASYELCSDEDYKLPGNVRQPMGPAWKA